MTIKLSPESEAFLATQVTAGLFPDPESVIETALRHLHAEQQWHAYATSTIDEGLAQSERGKFVSAEEIESLLDKYIRRPQELAR